jgi:hypothetical protein
MALLLFWLKIARRELLHLIKTSPVVVAWIFIIMCAVITGKPGVEIPLNQKTYIVVLSILIFASLAVSTRKFTTIHWIIMYAKANRQNKMIRFLFFARQAVFSNIMLFLFSAAVYKGMIQTEFGTYLPVAICLSIVSSFTLMVIKDKISDAKIAKAPRKSPGISPRARSVISDYTTAGFLQEAIVCIALFVFVISELARDKNLLDNMEYPSAFLTGLLLLIALGFMGIIDSIPHIHWKFYAIISPAALNYHIRRTFIFLTAFFSIFIFSFIFAIILFDLQSLIKYIYAGISLLFFTINVSFSAGSMLIKAFAAVICAMMTAWICNASPWFLALLILPVGISFLKAKNEYTEWYLL